MPNSSAEHPEASSEEHLAPVGSAGPHPVLFLIAMLPAGIGNGFVTIALPFVARRAGLSVSVIASIVAIGLMPLVLMIAWSPVVDLVLSYRRWCRIGMVFCAGMLVLLSALPIRATSVHWITSAAFALMVGTTFVAVPLGGLMAYAVPERLKGRSAGYFQAGLGIGLGAGGGAGVWLAAHSPRPVTAGLVLGAVCLLCMLSIRAIPDPRRLSTGGVLPKILGIGREFLDIVRRPNGALVVVLVMSPIGVGAANNLWSAVAEEWHASADTVALVTGVAGAFVTAVGCAAAGWWADRADRRAVYLVTGGILILIGIGLALTPRTPPLFATGTLSYAMGVGACNAAYSALILGVIGRGAAASKFTIINGLGNLPTSYMTALDGWVHDRSSAAGMLLSEALICLVAIGVAVLALRKLREVQDRFKTTASPRSSG